MPQVPVADVANRQPSSTGRLRRYHGKGDGLPAGAAIVGRGSGKDMAAIGKCQGKAPFAVSVVATMGGKGSVLWCAIIVNRYRTARSGTTAEGWAVIICGTPFFRQPGNGASAHPSRWR